MPLYAQLFKACHPRATRNGLGQGRVAPRRMSLSRDLSSI